MRARAHRRPAGARRRVATVAAALAAALVAAAGAALSIRSPSPSRSVAAPAGVPAPLAPAFVPGPARRLGSLRYVSHWAPVKRAADVYAAAGGGAVITRVETRTPEGTRNAVAVIRDGRPPGAWVHVRLPVLPNGTTGFVRRSALGGYETVHTRLVVDLATLRATLYRDGRVALRAPVGVGAPGWETPRGEFYVRNELTRYSSPAYGPVAFGTSARSPHATDWPAGGYVGIHGTDAPQLIPGRVSHGCIRLRNPDILALARRMPVGTPVTIR